MKPLKTASFPTGPQKFFGPFFSFLKEIFSELREFNILLLQYLLKHISLSFLHLESKKSSFVAMLYRQRGKYARRLMHSGMAALSAVGVVIAPAIAQEFPGRSVDPWTIPSSGAVLSISTDETNVNTQFSDKKFRDKIMEYTVQEGDTLSTVAEKFGISTDTVRWENNLSEKDTIKVGQVLKILPVTGLSHKVQKGDTIYSIGKKYDSSEQAVVDFPYNTFVNDETFELAIGQIVIVPDGVKPEDKPVAVPRTRQSTPNAGTVVASGSFVWPTNGTISQRFSWYHPGIDIANRAAPAVLAVDAGKVVVSGWVDNYGFGNRVVIDHGNGYRTTYAHLSRIYVTVGQTVNRGDSLGQMGNTGRSTGTHLHFEVTNNGARVNPLNILK
jgi:murein DD-endopeptidase MepM/ murein hydrolase activator NlpD